jgi:thioredoxin reductase (NADPH)
MGITHDVIIIGAGPAGLAAGIYSSRARLKTLILDKSIPGGQINNTDRIENYPGFLRISGFDLVSKMEEQCKTFGSEIRQLSEVTKITPQQDKAFQIEINHQETVTGRALILCPGSDYRKLGSPGEETFRQAGTGVSYCGTCDAPFFQDKTVLAVGGGNTAVQETLHLLKFVKKLYLVHRRKEFRAEKIMMEELMAHVDSGKVELVLDSVVKSINGDSKVRSAAVKNVMDNTERNIDCDGVFIFIGTIPNTGFLKGLIDMNEAGFIRCEPWYFRTNVEGIFVAGDCRVGAAMQLATAASDGVVCAIAVEKYFKDLTWWQKPGP